MVAVKAQHVYLCGRTPTTGVSDKGTNTCRHVNNCHTEHSGILGLGAVLLGLRLLTIQWISAFIFKGSKGEQRLLVGVRNLEDEDTTIL